MKTNMKNLRGPIIAPFENQTWTFCSVYTNKNPLLKGNFFKSKLSETFAI